MTPARDPAERRCALGAALAALLFALAVAPTLRWLEFSSGSENLVAATVLEMRRGGPWLVPTLRGAPRTTKPPLATWIAAAATSPATVRALDAPDPAARGRAAERLAWQLRWTALAAATLLLLATYDLGRTLGGPRVGLAALLICGSSLLLLRFARHATTDMHLALWVTVANAGLARALLAGQAWRGWLVAGAALGLAMMSKGPPALLQSILPALIVALARRDTRAAWRRQVAPALAGAAILLAIALPWPVAVVLRHDGMIAHWWSELTREGATDLPPDPWYVYFAIVPYMAPWVVMLVGGAGLCFMRRTARREGLLFAAALLVVPLATMSLVKDKNERYMLPMAAAASIVAAFAFAEQFKPQRRPEDRLALTLHHATLGAVLAGLPLAGRFVLQRADGAPWHPLAPAIAAALGAAALVAASIFLARTRPWAPAWATFVGMLAAQAIFIAGYRHSEDGLSKMRPLAEAVRALAPDATAVYLDPRPHSRLLPVDMLIYLNRLVPQADPDALGALPDPLVAIMQQRRGEPAPSPGEGFTRLASATWSKSSWHAFARRAPVDRPPATRPAAGGQ